MDWLGFIFSITFIQVFEMVYKVIFGRYNSSYSDFWYVPYVIVIAWILFICLLSYPGIGSMFKKYSSEFENKDLTGARVAEKILDLFGLKEAKVECSKDDFRNSYVYRKKKKCIYLSNFAYDKPTPAAVSAAAHECAHMIQRKENYTPLKLMRILYYAFYVAILILWGYDFYLIFSMGYEDEYSFLTKIIVLTLVAVTMITYLAAWVFAIISETNTNKRALKILKDLNVFGESEIKTIEKALKHMWLSGLGDENTYYFKE